MNTAKNEKKDLQDLKKCNKCGQILNTEHQMEYLKISQDGNLSDEMKSSMITLEIPWGYFSGKDGEIHKIILCENCYDEWIRSFQIPIEIKENVELL